MNAHVDPLDVLERIHKDVALLRELTGDALTITIEAAQPKVTDAPPGDQPTRETPTRVPTTKASGRDAEERVRGYLQKHGAAPRAVIGSATGMDRKRVDGALRRLEKAGKARPTGEVGRAEGVTIGRPSAVWEPVDADDEPAPDPEPEPPPDPEPTTPPAAPKPPALSPRVRKSLEREQADARAIAALGDPPTSRVLDLVRDRALNISQLASQLGTSRVLVAEEIHHLKPWLIQLHDGRVRALEHLRREAA